MLQHERIILAALLNEASFSFFVVVEDSRFRLRQRRKITAPNILLGSGNWGAIELDPHDWALAIVR